MNNLFSTWKGFNLLNMFYQGNKNRDSHFDENDFKMMSEWGFNFARLPIDYRILINSNDWNSMNELAMQRIDKAIEYGKRYNIHICLNLHRAPGYTVASPPEPTNLWTQKEPQEAFVRMWEYFTRRYKNIPNENLSFNFLNEPADVDEASYAAVIKLAANAIRAIDPARLLIADGLDYGRKPSYMLKELNIMQATRGYEPFNLTHYKAGWVKGAEDFPVPAWPDVEEAAAGGEVTPRKWLWEKYFKPWEEFIKNGGRVIVGEWGAHNRTPHNVVLKWMEDNLQNFKEAGIGWAMWNLNDSFGILDSGRTDAEYVDFNGRKLDLEMLNLLRRYIGKEV
ncbi:MAG: glycoside hydrolase family 5 protein [Treponema sp.]|nr:glycoside hydrolase family 5 protein [Treponema sp.]MCL2272740.1 glycoside hydrolase family 5 protein [Treponema sp.]